LQIRDPLAQFLACYDIPVTELPTLLSGDVLVIESLVEMGPTFVTGAASSSEIDRDVLVCKLAISLGD
jgi:hypothetical protein